MTARLANALYWMFSGVAVVLLLCVVGSIWGNANPANDIQFTFVFFGAPAFLALLFGRLCHYILGGDAWALWERALIARARRSPKFRKISIGVVLLAAMSVVWSILDAQHREARQEQEYEQQLHADAIRGAEQAEAQRQADAREEAQRKAAQQEEAQREEAQRQAAIEAQRAAQQAAVDRKAAALRDATINPGSLSINVMIGTSYGGEGIGVWKPMDTELTGTVVNHSDKTLRALEIKVQVRDCPQCLVTGEWAWKYGVDVPPGQQRTFGGEAWRMKSDGKWYTWQLLIASACHWSEWGEANANAVLVCQ